MTRRILLFVFAAAVWNLPPAEAHDIVPTGPLPPGAPGVWTTVYGELFEDPSPLPPIVIPGLPGLLSVVPGQMGLARGYAEAVNGIVLANDEVEDIDDDGPPIPPIAGGLPPLFPDPLLAGVLGADFVLPAPLLTDDAAILLVPITNASAGPIEVILSFTFVTFEFPGDPVFADAFGIFLDGILVAGGLSNLGPDPFGAPWALAPSAAVPSEFSAAFPLPAVVPAFTTGRVRVPLVIAPGIHFLDLHVADGSLGPPDDVVSSALFFGVEAYHSLTLPATGVVPAGGPQTIDFVGHPAAFGPPTFYADLAVTLTGAPPLSPAILLLGTGSAALPLPLVAPASAFVAFPPPVVLGLGLTDPAGGAAFPIPGPIPPAVVGAAVYFQWWVLDLAAGAFTNTSGLRFVIGPP
jgi:hypothetical protein